MKKIIRSALIVGGISAISTLTAMGHCSWDALYSAFLGFGMAFLLECKNKYDTPPTIKKILEEKKAELTFFF